MRFVTFRLTLLNLLGLFIMHLMHGSIGYTILLELLVLYGVELSIFSFYHIRVQHKISLTIIALLGGLGYGLFGSLLYHYSDSNVIVESVDIELECKNKKYDIHIHHTNENTVSDAVDGRSNDFEKVIEDILKLSPNNAPISKGTTDNMDVSYIKKWTNYGFYSSLIITNGMLINHSFSYGELTEAV